MGDLRSDTKDIAGSKFGMLTALKVVKVHNRTYWECVCECGNSKVSRSDSLRSGKTNNCGCLTSSLISEANKLPAGDAHINLALHFYKKGARDRGLEFAITRDEFIKVASGDCAYCGVTATEESAPYARPILTSLHPLNGIDRVNSKLGYTTDNVVPCCSRCNQIKMDMDVEEFIDQVRRIASHYKGSSR